MGWLSRIFAYLRPAEPELPAADESLPRPDFGAPVEERERDWYAYRFALSEPVRTIGFEMRPPPPILPKRRRHPKWNKTEHAYDLAELQVTPDVYRFVLWQSGRVVRKHTYVVPQITFPLPWRHVPGLLWREAFDLRAARLVSELHKDRSKVRAGLNEVLRMALCNEPGNEWHRAGADAFRIDPYDGTPDTAAESLLHREGY